MRWVFPNRVRRIPVKVDQMSLVSLPLGLPDVGLVSSLKLGFSAHCGSCGISGWSEGLVLSRAVSTISNKGALLEQGRTDDGLRIWWKRGQSARCAGKENPRFISRGAVGKRRPTRTVGSVVERIERTQEATERRASGEESRREYPYSLLRSLDERIRQNQWQPALRVFELVRAQEWYTADLSTYLKLLTMLAKAKQAAEASNVFDCLLEDKLRPTTAIFTALLTVFTQSNQFKKALEIFESMRLYEGCVPDKYTYTAMIKGCCEAGLYVQARKIFDEMMIEGVKPSIVTYNILIHGYGKAGLFREVERVLSTMEANNVAPDTVTWNTLIRVFGLNCKIPEMEQAYEGLLRQGLQPDMVTLNSLISAYGTAGLFEKMESVTQYMQRYNYPMTRITYNIIMEAYGRAGMVDQMEETWKRMKAEFVKPNSSTFCSMLSAYGRHGYWHNVEKVMRQARYFDAADTAVYNAAIDAFQRAQNFEDMEKIFEEMKLKGHAPDDVTYSILIGAYERIRRVDKARDLQEEWNGSVKECEAE
ncbi:uncharacterized protein [Physcomitrium patens]|uniref:Pentacotripeptide-repeat region of PRORP domain-containing protein n=1 Tax=Physcomitrium patens TaxID=3218 RepID=A0A7I4FUD4_PHYPA|nr:pentatricopeptide repeat-containing protein At3g53170-like [Physcomitrium patens]XP_024383420.1 pentatricopeptide repeat-containing protein At3g53170-like [Physcomitrium patens]XP_024383421.1 pentatricopeptide repeat-containing protein At3g53170-like [Physcomitrium patens]XP_024383422.1 pentatricopeptide repeat-containing protein At3g53170-like [Physcomitrium patens]|eukprot:XP_024383418.1 pentatricopeptide repeat-containing protein At3g53170-like [Physcomitrella patens]